MTMRTLLVFSLLALFSCKTTQPASSGGQTDALTQLNNRWTLVEVKGEKVENLTYNSTPNLEIKTADKRLSGSDGCNNFFGQLDVLDQSRIEIGLLGSTKAICPEIKNSDMLGQYLNAVKTYRVDQRFLYLYDEAGHEVLKYKLSE